MPRDLPIIKVADDLFAPQVSDAQLARAYARMLVDHDREYLITTQHGARMSRLTRDSAFIERVREALHHLSGNDGYRLMNGWWAHQNVGVALPATNQQEVEAAAGHLISAAARIRVLDLRRLEDPVDLYAALFGDKYRWTGEAPKIPGMNALFFLDGFGYGLDMVITHEAAELDWSRSLRDQCDGDGTAFHHLGGPLDGRTWDQLPYPSMLGGNA